MAKNNYYAIRKGFKSNVIVNSWDECKKNIDGYSGAEYKGFSREEDAREYLVGELNQNAGQPSQIVQKVYCESPCEFMVTGICTAKKVKIDKNGQCKNY